MSLLNPQITQDITNTKPEDFTPIPEGQYTLRVAKAEIKSTKDGTGQYINVEFDVIAPSYQGRKIFNMFNISNRNVDAERIGKQQLKSLILAGGVQEPFVDTDQLVGSTVIATVTIRQAEGGYEAQNAVKGFKKVGGVGVTASVGDAILPPFQSAPANNFSAAFQPAHAPAQQAFAGGWNPQG